MKDREAEGSVIRARQYLSMTALFLALAFGCARQHPTPASNSLAPPSPM